MTIIQWCIMEKMLSQPMVHQLSYQAKRTLKLVNVTFWARSTLQLFENFTVAQELVLPYQHRPQQLQHVSVFLFKHRYRWFWLVVLFSNSESICVHLELYKCIDQYRSIIHSSQWFSRRAILLRSHWCHCSFSRSLHFSKQYCTRYICQCLSVQFQRIQSICQSHITNRWSIECQLEFSIRSQLPLWSQRYRRCFNL